MPLNLLSQGQEIRATVSFSVAEKRCCPYYHRVLNLLRNKLQTCKQKKMLQKVELGSTLRNILLQLATLIFVRGKLSTRWYYRQQLVQLTCSETMLRDKLNENVARFTLPLLFSREIRDLHNSVDLNNQSSNKSPALTWQETTSNGNSGLLLHNDATNLVRL